MVHIVSSFCCWRWLFSCVCVCVVVVCINIGTLLVVTVARLLFLYTCASWIAPQEVFSSCVIFFFWLFSYIFLFFLSDCVLSTVRVWPMLLYTEAVVTSACELVKSTSFSLYFPILFLKVTEMIIRGETITTEKNWTLVTNTVTSTKKDGVHSTSLSVCLSFLSLSSALK